MTHSRQERPTPLDSCVLSACRRSTMNPAAVFVQVVCVSLHFNKHGSAGLRTWESHVTYGAVHRGLPSVTRSYNSEEVQIRLHNT